MAQRVIQKISLLLMPVSDMEERLTATVKAELPEFQVKDFEMSSMTLKELFAKWTSIQKGKSTRKLEQVEEGTTANKVAQFKIALAAFSRLVDGAEMIVSARKEKKDKKDNKKDKKDKDEKRSRRSA